MTLSLFVHPQNMLSDTGLCEAETPWTVWCSGLETQLHGCIRCLELSAAQSCPAPTGRILGTLWEVPRTAEAQTSVLLLKAEDFLPLCSEVRMLEGCSQCWAFHMHPLWLWSQMTQFKKCKSSKVKLGPYNNRERIQKSRADCKWVLGLDELWKTNKPKRMKE